MLVRPRRFGFLGLAALVLACGCHPSPARPSDDGGTVSDGSVQPDTGTDASFPFDLGVDLGAPLDASSGGDASGGDAGVIPTGPILRVFTPTVGSYTTLVQGELLVVEARLENSLGLAVIGGRVDFALIGDPKDTSLSDFFALTGADGYARAFVQAGQVPATFTLRVTGPDGPPVYAMVEVAPTPTLDFTVSLSDAAALAVTPLGVFAFADRTCDSVAGVPPSQGAVFEAGQTSTVVSLPTGVDYAIVVEADDGLSILSTCIDGVDPTTLTSSTVDFGFGP